MHLETNLFEIFGFLPYGFLTNLVLKKISQRRQGHFACFGCQIFVCFFFIVLYVDFLGRTMLYMWIEYHI